MPPGLRDRARAAGINVSGVAANAVSRIVETSEKRKTPASSRQTIAGATASVRRAS